jgi:hypothetical protein
LTCTVLLSNVDEEYDDHNHAHGGEEEGDGHQDLTQQAVAPSLGESYINQFKCNNFLFLYTLLKGRENFRNLKQLH